MFHSRESNYHQIIYQASPRFQNEAGLYIDLLGTFSSFGGFSFRQTIPVDAVHVIHEGSGEVVVNGTAHPVRENDLFILRKGTFYEYRDHPDSPWRYTYFHLNGDRAGAILDRIGLTVGRPVWTPVHEDGIRPLLTRLHMEFERERMQGYACIAAAWEMIRQLEATLLNTTDSDTADPAAAARQLIDHSPVCISSVDGLAGHLGISRTTLFRAFTRAYGLSVKHYMEQVRFERMNELVRRTALPIGQIAEIGGFSDPLYFSRAFRKRFGISPSQMRSSQP